MQGRYLEIRISAGEQPVTPRAQAVLCLCAQAVLCLCAQAVFCLCAQAVFCLCAQAAPLAAYPRCERLGREQLATLLTIVAAAGERAWRVRSVAAAWGEIIGKVHTGYIGLQPGGAWGCSLRGGWG